MNSPSFSALAFAGKPYADPTDWRGYHALYQDATPDFKAAVDEAYDAATDSLKASGIKVAYSDQAERFVAGIVRYIHESCQAGDAAKQPSIA